MNRRRFLKYAGSTAAVVGASALGLDYLQMRSLNPTSNQITTTVVVPPTIEDLKWIPTRTQNGKVYEGRITFNVRNPAFDEAILDFQPYLPTQVPRAAFPAEDPRTFSLTPVSSASNLGRLDFSKDIMELKGGKAYRAIATIRDAAGHEVLGYTDTPYVREFENISSQANIRVSAHYGPFLNPALWSGRSKLDNNTTNPLLGWYTSGDPFVTAKHIDWAGGFGISCLTLIWFGSTFFEPRIRQILTHAALHDLRFFIWYDLPTQLQHSVGPENSFGPWDVNDPAVRRVLQESLEYWIRNYFDHSSYLKIAGAHPVYYFGVSRLLGDVTSTMNQLRKTAEEEGVDLFLISDSVDYNRPTLSKIAPYDAITQFANHSFVDPEMNADIERAMDDAYTRWSSVAKSSGVHFIPSVEPGYKNLYFKDWLVFPRSVPGFKNRLEIGKRHLDPDLRMLFVTTFNDWMENTHIEPTVEEGFAYLDAIKESAMS